MVVAQIDKREDTHSFSIRCLVRRKKSFEDFGDEIKFCSLPCGKTRRRADKPDFRSLLYRVPYLGIVSRVPKPRRKKRGKGGSLSRCVRALHVIYLSIERNIHSSSAAPSDYIFKVKRTACIRISYPTKDELSSEVRSLQKPEFCVPAFCDSQRNVLSPA